MSDIPTLHELIGLAIQVGEPLLSSRVGSTPVTYTDELDAYSHKRSAFMDYDKAHMALKGDHLDAEDWIEYGLGRDVTTFDSALDPVWKGFVNQLEVVIGNLTIRRGPLMALGNRVSAVYAILDNTVNPPTVGDRTVTVIAEDTDSQAEYGIIEKVISTGQVSTSEAERLRDTFLDENSLPETSQGINSASAQPGITITMNCLGYGYWLDAYVYNQNVNSGTTTISAKLEAVLAAEPNAIISVDYDKIDTNGFLVSRYENDDPYGLTMIKELTALGDINADRWLFMLDNDRRAKYFIQPSTREYEMSISEGTIRDLVAGLVHPWNIKPGKWIFVNDFLTGRGPEVTNLREDPRMVFVESVDYSAPYTYSIEGSKTNTVKQILSQFGMKGLIS